MLQVQWQGAFIAFGSSAAVGLVGSYLTSTATVFSFSQRTSTEVFGVVSPCFSSADRFQDGICQAKSESARVQDHCQCCEEMLRF